MRAGMSGCWPVLLVLAMLALAGCASAPVPAPARLGLKLAPATLGAAISVQQHLRVERGGRIDELDAALEVDASQLDLVGLAFGQRVLSLHYDGQQMTTWRHMMLPAQVRAEDVLEDLQLTLWPVQAVRAALPAGWTVEEQDRDGRPGSSARRTLALDGQPVTVIDYSTTPRWSGTVQLENLRYHYRLTIQTAAE